MLRSDDLRELIDDGLRELLPESSLECAHRLNEAIAYAIFPGGKRLRPILTLQAAAAVGGNLEQALPAACAIEFLHTSSLILDDLPCMDDAAFRRGNAALHVEYGEETALLAAIALLNQAYGIFAESPELLREAVSSVGVNGMVGGQAVDLALRRCSVGGALNASIRKTSALMRLTMVAGAMACSASGAQIEALGHAGECLGQAYQICDDVLDRVLDARHQTPSHLVEAGAMACGRRVATLVEEAKRSIARELPKAGARVMAGAIDSIVGTFSRAGVVTVSA